MLDRLFAAAQLRERVAQVVRRLEKLWLKPQRLAVRPDRLFKPPELLKQVRQIEVLARCSRFQRQRPLISFSRLGFAARRQKDVGKRLLRVGVVRTQRNRLSIFHDGFIELFGSVEQGGSEVAMRLGLGGRQGNGAAMGRDGVIRPPAAGQKHAQIGQDLRVVRSDDRRAYRSGRWLARRGRSGLRQRRKQRCSESAWSG